MMSGDRRAVLRPTSFRWQCLDRFERGVTVRGPVGFSQWRSDVRRDGVARVVLRCADLELRCNGNVDAAERQLESARVAPRGRAGAIGSPTNGAPAPGLRPAPSKPTAREGIR